MTVDDQPSTAGPAFDPLAGGSVTEIRASLREVRASGCPVSHVAPGLTFLAGHEVARRALLDGRAMSNAGNFVLGDEGDGEAPPALITQSDAPEHTALRALLRPGFARAAITDAAPWVRGYADELIDALPAGGPADIVGDVAMPLTARVIARLVGVPAEDSDELARLSLEITAILPAPFVGTDAWQRLEEYFVAASVARRSAEDPPDDMITRLVRGRVDGRELSDREVAFHAWQLFVAGLESTAYTIGATVHHLLADRSRWEALLADRSLLDAAREEGLRHGSAIRWVLRTVAEPTELGGVALTPGERVVVGLESANMDEEVFGGDADDFVLGRPSARRHFSFGHGVHLCLGAELSRIEISTVLNALLDRLPGLRLAPDAEWRDVASPMFCGPQRVDVVW
jgi:cytochrome P450